MEHPWIHMSTYKKGLNSCKNVKTDWLKINRTQNGTWNPTMMLLCDNEQWTKIANYLCKVAPLQVFGRDLNMPQKQEIVTKQKIKIG